MKRLLRLYLLLYAVNQILCSRNTVAIAVSQVIRDFYVENSENFDLFVFGAETEKFKNLVNDVVKVTKGLSPCKKIEVKHDEGRIDVRQSAIWLFDNVTSYTEFHSRVDLMSTSPRKFNFLVYIVDWPILQLDHLEKHNILVFSQQSFIFNSNGSISLWTYSRFHQPDCKQYKKELLNKFSNSRRKWRKNTFFVEKFGNFNGCELIIGIPYTTQPFFSCDFTEDETEELIKCWGSGVKLIEYFGESLNFTFRFNPMTRGNQVYDSSLIRDVFVQAQRLRFQIYNSTLVATHPFTTCEVFIIVSREVTYTQFEKLFLPFEVEVWNWLIATTLIGVLTILIVKFAPQNVQRFVFGNYISTPMLNLIIVAFGLGMLRSPGRNFARFLLMSYILFCLIMRTAYQGKQFEFLTKEMRRPHTKTFDGLVKQNFTLFTFNPSIRIGLKRTEPLNRISLDSITIFEVCDPEFIKKLLTDGSKRAVVITSEIRDILYALDKGQIELTRLEESIITDNMALILRNDNFMTLPFHQKITRLAEAGSPCMP